MTLLSDTAYHSFIGEVEALNTTTIRRLTPSCRHQLLAIAPRRLRAEATTPRLKQYLGEVIARYERLEGEIVSASEKY